MRSSLLSRGRGLLLASAFSPRSISGLALWLDGSRGLWQDSARTTPATADGDPVGAWDDQSGNGRHATQSSAAKRGTLKLGIVNGRQVVRFDGVDDSLQVASLTLTTFCTVVHVGKWDDATKLFFVEHSPNSNTNDGFYFYGKGGGAWSVRRSGSSHFVAGVNEWALGGFHVAAFTYNGAGAYYLNGAAQANGTITGTARSNSTVTAALNIGSRDQTTLLSSADWGDLFIYEGALSTDQLGRLHTWAYRRYALSGSLP